MKKDATLLTATAFLALFHLSHADSQYTINNNSSVPIVITMTSARKVSETHSVANGSATFITALPNDRVAFSVYLDADRDGKPDTPEKPIYRFTIPAHSANRLRGVWNWDGKELK